MTAGGSRAIYAAMTQNLDADVGRVLAALKRAGRERDTLVIFTSDNGGERYSYNWPFSGEKFDLHEGGTRVPAIARWPGVIAANATTIAIKVPRMTPSSVKRPRLRTPPFEVKRAAECLMPGAELIPSAPRSYEHPARAAELIWRGGIVGRVFELHPSVIEGRAAILYVNLDTMLALSQQDRRYTPPRRYPSSAFDLSVIAGARELAGDLLKNESLKLALTKVCSEATLDVQRARVAPEVGA